MHSDNLARGYQLGDYSLLERIGAGGEGVVWSAWDNRRRRVAAVKIISILGDDAINVSLMTDDFQRQVHLVASLDHPHILPLYEFGSTDDYHYFVMQYSCIGSLAKKLAAKPMPVPEALEIIAQITSALSYLHTQGVVYRDLKPSNVLLDSQNRVYLADFGLAKQLSQMTWAFHTGRGTGPYAPYEQHLRMSMTPQSDIFSLGIMVYEMLAGSLPWDGNDFLALRQQLGNESLPDIREVNPTLPKALSDILRQMTAHQLQDRPPNAAVAFNLLVNAFPSYAEDSKLQAREQAETIPDKVIIAEDARYLLDLLLSDWDADKEEFPARLTHLALIDAAHSQVEEPLLTLSSTEKMFMLRGTLAHDFHLDYWWPQVAAPEDRLAACEQTIILEDEAAVNRAVTQLAETFSELPLPSGSGLTPATQDRLVDIVVEQTSWALKNNALQLLELAAPQVSRWQETGISATSDAHLAHLAMGESSHAQQAARLIGQMRSKTAVQALLDTQEQTGELRLMETLQEIRTQVGSLPRLVPFQTRARIIAGQMAKRLLEEREGLSVPRIAIGLLVGVLMSLIMALGMFSRPNDQARDILLAPYPVSDIITIVAIDDASLEEYGRWDAWPRTLHADLVDKLTAAGAKAIAFDVLFDSATADDATLALAMQRAGNVVQPVLGQGDGYHNIPGTVRFNERILPKADLLTASAAVGHTNILHDEDGYVRQVPTIASVDEERFLSLAMATLQVYLTGEVDLETVPAPENGRLSFAGRQIPVGTSGEMLIYYAGPPTQSDAVTFQTVSYQAVLDGSAPDDLFRDKIVLIGITATAEPDRYLTPVSDGRPMYGVEIIANVIESIWSNRFLVRPHTLLLMAVLLGLGFLTGLVCTRPRFGLVLTLGIGVLYFLTATLLLDTTGIMLDLLFPFLTIALSYVAVTAYRFSVEVQRRRQIMQLFESNVTPKIAQATMEAVRKGEINLGGQVQEVTILFVDIRGSQTYTEQQEPKQVIKAIDYFRNIVVETALKMDGTIAQHEGKQVMIIFNAPLPQTGHAWRAVNTAFALRQRVGDYQTSISSDHPHQLLGFGYGIHSGQAIVGNAGTAPHHAYTALGNTVSIASQLASQSKPAQILVGEATYNQVVDRIAARPLMPILLREHSLPLSVYDALKPAEPSPDEVEDSAIEHDQDKTSRFPSSNL